MRALRPVSELGVESGGNLSWRCRLAVGLPYGWDWQHWPWHWTAGVTWDFRKWETISLFIHDNMKFPPTRGLNINLNDDEFMTMISLSVGKVHIPYTYITTTRCETLSKFLSQVQHYCRPSTTSAASITSTAVKSKQWKEYKSILQLTAQIKQQGNVKITGIIS